MHQKSPSNDDRSEPSSASMFITPLVLTVIAVAGSFLVYYQFRANATKGGANSRDIAQEARDDLTKRNFKPLSEPMEAILKDPSYESIPTQSHPALLQSASPLNLKDTEGKSWDLEAARANGPVVLVFYYGYHCNHCVSQLFALDKDLEKFRELNAQVVAVSADPPELTLERYKKYGPFHFPVLSDSGNKLAEAYGCYTPSPKAGEDGNLLHGTFIIDRDGRIVWTNRGDEPFIENRTLLREIARIEGRLPASPPTK